MAEPILDQPRVVAGIYSMTWGTEGPPLRFQRMLGWCETVTAGRFPPP
jgi:hypothetical protein